MVEFKKQNGNLVITLTNLGREFIDDALANGTNIDSDEFMTDLFEGKLCNGWELLRPEEIGALTGAPILSDETERDDSGSLKKLGRVYWFPNYQIESPIRTLWEKEIVTFEGVTGY